MENQSLEDVNTINEPQVFWGD